MSSNGRLIEVVLALHSTLFPHGSEHQAQKHIQGCHDPWRCDHHDPSRCDHHSMLQQHHSKQFGYCSIDAGKQVSHYWYDLGEEEEEEACSFALCLITDSVKLGVLKAVIDLGVLEIIKKCGPGGCLSSAVIAARLTTTNPAAAAKLGRLLDFLVSYSILTVVIHTLPGGAVERRYGVAPVCKFLTPNEDGVSLAPFTNEAMHKALVDSSLCLKDAVLEGVNPFTKVYGMTFYEYSGKHPEHQKGFHEAMTHHSTLILQKVLRTYKGFEGLSSLVDVGGGRGATLSMILSRYPTIKGINFDQPHVIADAPSYSGVEHKGGDMFVNIPKGDGIFLKWICHCFSDEDCIRILKNCYDALPEELGKVIICEYLLPDANETTPSSIVANSVVHLDMIMMALFGGKERTEKEFKALAMSSGFQGFQVVCSAYNVNIIELLK